MPIDQKLFAEIMAYAGRKKFRGGIYENQFGAPMGKGHGNDGKPLDIETVCYLKPILAGIEKHSTRQVDIMGAVKTLKSFTTEMALAYYCAHGIGDCTYYFGTGEMADDQACSRILAYLWGIPSMAEKRKTMTGQYDETMGAIKFPDKTLRLKPANISNTQDVNLCFIGVRDAFVTGKTGMIDQAIARTTQYPNDKKIILESQGGEEDFDFDRHYLESDQGELHVICPLCGTPQIFNWRGWFRERGEDFTPIPPLIIPSLDHQSWLDYHRPILISPERRKCGFKRGDETKIKHADGSYNKQEILRGTYYECYSCGGEWHDDGEHGKMRIALDQSSHYISRNPKALESHLGFNIPQWINRRIVWGEVMLNYLIGLQNKNKFGNEETIKQWWQKVGARSWGENIESFIGRVTDSVYDPKTPLPNRAKVFCLVDCQENLEHFWVDGWEVDKGANIRMLFSKHIRATNENGVVISAKKNVEKLIKEWEIPVNHVGIDDGHLPDEVAKWAADNAFIGAIVTGRGNIIQNGILTWRLLSGSRKHEFRWSDGRRKWFDSGYKDRGFNRLPIQIIYQEKPLTIFVTQTNCSSLRYSDIARRYRDREPNHPTITILPEIARETGPESFNEQMFSEYRTTERGNPIWKKSGRHNHRWDNLKNLMAMMDIFGLRSYESGELENSTEETNN